MPKGENASWNIQEADNILVGGEGREQSDLDKREELALKVVEVAENKGWSKAEVSRRAGVPDGTFNQWLSGKYTGRFDNTNTKIANWLAAIHETDELAGQMPTSPAFIKLDISDKINNALVAAQMMPTMVMVTCEAGMTKTSTAKRYLNTHPHTFLATMTPHSKTAHSCLLAVADAVGIQQPNPHRVATQIGQKLRRNNSNSLLIIDEAQDLSDEAINQLRNFVDVYGCGVALLGNTEVYDRFGKWSSQKIHAQLRRRIFMRMRETKMSTKDLEKFIKAWGITDKGQTTFLTGIGLKPGALGQIDMTVKLAKLLAAGEGIELTEDHLRKAWANRDVETL